LGFETHAPTGLKVSVVGRGCTGVNGATSRRQDDLIDANIEHCRHESKKESA
jgi:hypothetical protein